MSWSDPCRGGCGYSRADCECKMWDTMSNKLMRSVYTEIVDKLRKEFDKIEVGGPGKRLIINNKVITGLLLYPDMPMNNCTNREFYQALIKEIKIQLHLKVKFREVPEKDYFHNDKLEIWQKMTNTHARRLCVKDDSTYIYPDTEVYLTKEPISEVSEEGEPIERANTVKLKDLPDGLLFTFPYIYNTDGIWKKSTVDGKIYVTELYAAENTASQADPEAEVYPAINTGFIEVAKLFKDINDNEFFRVKNKPGVWKIFIPNKQIKYVVRIDLPDTSAQTMDPDTQVCTCLPDADPKVIYSGGLIQQTIIGQECTTNPVVLYEEYKDHTMNPRPDISGRVSGAISLSQNDYPVTETSAEKSTVGNISLYATPKDLSENAISFRVNGEENETLHFERPSTFGISNELLNLLESIDKTCEESNMNRSGRATIKAVVKSYVDVHTVDINPLCQLLRDCIRSLNESSGNSALTDRIKEQLKSFSDGDTSGRLIQS